VEDLRRIPFLIAVLLAFLVVSAETGGLLVNTPASEVSSACEDLAGSDILASLGVNLANDQDKKACSEVSSLSAKVSGMSVPSLAFVDGIFLFIMAFMAAGLVAPQSITGRLQGIITFVFSILLLTAAVAYLLGALAKLLLMVGLLLSVPFGTIIYFIVYGSFPKGAMLALLSTIMLFKTGAVTALIIGHQRFLQNKALVLLIVTSFASSAIVSFLLGFAPGFLTSITDAVAAIVVGIIAVIWMVVLLISSLPAIRKAIG
jgi:hypothetical protein